MSTFVVVDRLSGDALSYTCWETAVRVASYVHSDAPETDTVILEFDRDTLKFIQVHVMVEAC